MNREEICAQLKTLIETQEDKTISDSDQELDLDSFTMMLCITFVREKVRVEIDMDQLDFDAFTSLNTFADIVLSQEKSLGSNE